jgi:phage terminase small subunit
MQTLTPKQQRFVDEFLLDLNATQAAIRAGYSKSTARNIACENLTKPHIAKAVAAKRNAVSERTGFTLERLDAEIMSLYGKCRENGNYSVAARCLDLMGRRLGAFTDRAKTEQANYLDILLGAQPQIEERRKQNK